MNLCALMGRLTADPEIKDLGGESRLARYTLAVNRPFGSKGEKKVDFINCVAFGPSAINAEKYLKKGMLVVVQGAIHTGSYKNKEGRTVFTVDVAVERAEFAESKKAFEERRMWEKEKAEAQAASDAVSEETKEPEFNEKDHRPPVEDDWMNVDENFDEDNVPFS